MATLESVVQKINLLIEDANDTTGSLHNNLRDAVNALILGYGNIEVDSISEIHLWSKYTIGGSIVEEQVTNIKLFWKLPSSADIFEIDYADSYEIVDNAISLVNPTTITLGSDSESRNAIKGKYVKRGYVYYIPTDARVMYGNYTNSRDIEVDKATKITYTAGDSEFICIVAAEDINAYPQNGTQGGYRYVYNGTIDSSGDVPVLQSKSVTPSVSQQVVKADSNYDGLLQVTVAGDSDLVASNIKKGVNIFGVSGSYEGSGGVTLPTLTNPGTASDLAIGKQMIDGSGNVVTGTHECEEGIIPSGTIYITSNGTYDVTNLESANVNVPTTGGDVVCGEDIEVGSLSELHAWSKYSVGDTLIKTDETNVFLGTAQHNSGISVEYANKVDTSSGHLALSPDGHGTVKVTSDSTGSVLKGKVVRTSAGLYYEIPSTATVDFQSGTLYDNLYASEAKRITYTPSDGELVGIVVSEDSNAYPQNGEQDGYKYVYNGTLDDNASVPVLQSKSVIPSETAQTVTPDSGYDGLSSVSVAGDSDLVASNIKKGVEIFGVTGSYEATGSIALPTLTNPGVAEDLLAGKELIDENGNVITGTAVDKRTVLDSVDVTPEVLTVGSQTYIMHQYTPSKTMMVRDAVKLCASTYKFGNATADDVVAGKTFTSASGLKVTGTHECSGGVELPALTAPGSADDLANGKQLIDADGNVVTGTVPVVTMVTTTQGDTFVSFDAEGKQITMSGKLGERKIVDGNANVLMAAPASEFGDASASDVAKGKTFTSAAGRKVVGTMEHGGGFTVTDDGAGNVTITSSAITDNDGNVVIA